MLKSAPDGNPFFLVAHSTKATLYESSLTTPRKAELKEGQSNFKYANRFVKEFDTASPIQCIDISCSPPSTALVALGRQDGAFEIHSIGMDKMSSTVAAKQQRSCTSVKFNSLNQLAISLEKVRNDTSITLYDIQKNQTFASFANSEAVSSMAWSSDEHSIFAGVNYRWLRMIDTRMDSRDKIALSIPSKAVYEVTADASSRYNFASTSENHVYLWDSRKTDSPVLSLKTSAQVHGSKVNQLRFRPDRGSRLVSLSDDGTFDLWNLDLVEEELRASRVEAHAIYRSSASAAFDFMKLPSSFDLSCGLIFPARDTLQPLFHVVDLSRPRIGFTALGDFICLDQGKLSYDRSSNKIESSESLCLDDPDEDQDGTYGSECSNPEEGETDTSKQNMQQLLSAHLSEGASSEIVQAQNREVTEDVEPSIDISKCLSNDISSVMYRRITAGYGMDAATNEKVASEESLKTVWTWLNWTLSAAAAGQLEAEGLDFSMEGCLHIWQGIAGNPKKPIPPYSDAFFDAVETINSKFASDIFVDDMADAPLRQLALTSTGWCLTNEGYSTFQAKLIEEGQYSRAAFYVLAHSRDIDQVSAVMAKDGVDMASAISEYVSALGNDEALRVWKSECSARGVDLDSPYIRAIFSYLSANDWRDVIDEQGLTLRERLAIAFRYIRDEELGSILHDLCRTEVAEGNLEGLLLTGINAQSLDLLQAYINRTADLQTAVLIVAHKADLSDDKRVVQWISDYRSLLDTWGFHLARCRFDVARNHITKHMKLKKNSPMQVCLRCNHCNHIVPSSHTSGRAPNESEEQSHLHLSAARLAAPTASKSTLCSSCKRPLPKCVLCLTSIGNNKLLSFCLRCNHALHARHAEQWFERHRHCPAPNCGCECL